MVANYKPKVETFILYNKEEGKFLKVFLCMPIMMNYNTQKFRNKNMPLLREKNVFVHTF